MLIRIENFRGIRSLEMELPGGITVLIGPNDSGKSSTIEALYLGLTAFSGFKGGFIEYYSPSYLLMRRNTQISSLIFGNERVAGIDIQLDSKVYAVRIGKEASAVVPRRDLADELLRSVEEGIARGLEAMRGYDALMQLFAGLFQASILTETGDFATAQRVSLYGPKLPPKVDKIFGAFTDEAGEVYSAFVLYTLRNVPLLKLTELRKPDIRMDAILMDFASRRPIEEINRFLSEVIKRGMKEQVLEYLRLGNAQIESIDLIVEGSKVVPLVRYSWSEGGIPLELSGDGVKTLLAIALASKVLNNHFVLLEEPENHLHPRLMGVLSQLIVDSAGRGVKYVIATHSLEFLKYLLKSVSDVEVPATVYYMERRSDGSVKAMRYDKEEAVKKVVEFEIDLRG